MLCTCWHRTFNFLSIVIFPLGWYPDLKRKSGQGWVGRVWLRVGFDQFKVSTEGCRVEVKVVVRLG